jgi:alkanesulfonate monooxygenase SsuD/methylene tetrahydromethanopterin reductase-like flavin-dependent oxidoreductase (luciferase family)
MKAKLLAGGLFIVVLVSACTDREAEARRAKEEADAKARAEVARKEMDALPKAFKSEPFFKLNEPEKKPDPVPSPKKTNP